MNSESKIEIAFTITRTNSHNEDFQELVRQLDAFLEEQEGVEHVEHGRIDYSDTSLPVVVAFEHEAAIGCGAIRLKADGIMEMKRMYTIPEARGKGVAGEILNELETWAKELGARKCILETDYHQTEAVAFYLKHGYQAIDNYTSYADELGCKSFEKTL
jgi:putative acetyltransferase